MGPSKSTLFSEIRFGQKRFSSLEIIAVNGSTGSGHILIPFIIGIGAGWGTYTRILLQTFLVGMRDHFGDTERGTSMYKVFLIL